MSHYKRYYQTGGSYFFTVVTHQRRPLFSDPDNVKQLQVVFNKVKTEYPFTINAFVILPDHLHFIWRLPEYDEDFSTRWRLIKRYFSVTMKSSINHRKEKEVWQRRFWDHYIRDEEDWRKHMDYIHYNPVKHGLVASPLDWSASSFHRCVERGLYERNWGARESIIFTGMDRAE